MRTSFSGRWLGPFLAAAVPMMRQVTYTLASFNSDDGTTTFGLDLADFTLGSVISGYDFSLDLFADTLRLTATASAIPEPSTYAALLGALVLGLALHRRRRRNQA